MGPMKNVNVDGMGLEVGPPVYVAYEGADGRRTDEEWAWDRAGGIVCVDGHPRRAFTPLGDNIKQPTRSSFR